MKTVLVVVGICVLLANVALVSVRVMRTQPATPSLPAAQAGAVAPAGTATPRAPVALAPELDVYNVELKPPRVHAGADDNHAFVAKGVLHPGASETTTFALTRMERMNVLLLGEGMTYSFRSPEGREIVPGKTAKGGGYEDFTAPDGMAGFTLEHPADGTWTVMTTAGPGVTPRSYAIDLQLDGHAAESAHLEALLRGSEPDSSILASPGQPIFLRAFVTRDGRPIPGVEWSVTARSPANTAITIPVFDDGRHADGAAGDGISVGAFLAEGPDGFYQIRAEGRTPHGEQYVTASFAEVRAKKDVRIADSTAIAPEHPRAVVRVP